MRKRATKLVAVLGALAMTVTSVNVPAGAAVSIDAGQKKIYVNGPKAKKKTTVTVTGTSKKVTYSVDKKSVATVNAKGVVTAKKAGTVTVTAKYGNKKKTIKIKVIKNYVSVKSLKLSKTSIELDEGKTATFSATVKPTTASQLSCGAKVTSGKDVVSLGNSTGTKFQIKAIKGGEATVKVSTLGVNSDGVKLSATVAVKVNGVEAPETEAPATEAPIAVENVILDKEADTIVVDGSTQLNAVVTPDNAADKSVVWTTSDAKVATVDQNGLVTGVAEGTAVITATTVDGAKTASATITVDDVTNNNAAKVEMTLTNPSKYSDKNDTVLVGTNANVRVKVTDENGNPVANAPVTLGSRTVSGGYQGNLTDTTLYTDKNGYVTFVYGISKQIDDKKVIDSMSTEYIGSYVLTAKVAGSNAVTADTPVKFAAIKLGTDATTSEYDNDVVTVMNKNNIVPDSDATVGVYKTTDQNEMKVEYVASQQVSPAGTDAHKVVLSTKAYLVMPGDQVKADSLKGTIAVDKSTGKYYTNEQKDVSTVVDVDPSRIQTATVNFKNIKISKETKMCVDFYVVDSKDVTLEQVLKGAYKEKISSTVKYAKDIVSNALSVQIPQASYKGYLFIHAHVNAAGQVDINNNDGLTLESINYTYKNMYNNVAATLVDMKNFGDVKVEWAEETAKYESVDVSKYAKIYNAITATYPAAKNYTYETKVPTFPSTGNAIITVKNANKNVVAIYAVPTENPYDLIPVKDSTGTIRYEVKYKNINVIVDDAKYMYKISAEQATALTKATSTQNSAIVGQTESTVTLNSEYTGITNLVGTIVSDNEDIVLDDSNRYVYSSVQWAPVENSNITSNLATAFAGQTVNLTAQLFDKNGNKKSDSGVNVWFTADGIPMTTGTWYGVGTKTAKVRTITNGSANNNNQLDSGLTNDQGQVTLVMNSANAESIRNIVAHTSAKYDVKIKLGDTYCDIVDLYWLTLGLNFDPTVDVPWDDVTGNYTVYPTVGESWEYGVKLFVNGDAEDTNLPQGFVVSGIETAITGVDANATAAILTDDANKPNPDAVRRTVRVSSKTATTLAYNFTVGAAQVKNPQIVYDWWKPTAYLGDNASNISFANANFTLNTKWLVDGVIAGGFDSLQEDGKNTAVVNDTIYAYYQLKGHGGDINNDLTAGNVGDYLVTLTLDGDATFVDDGYVDYVNHSADWKTVTAVANKTTGRVVYAIKSSTVNATATVQANVDAIGTLVERSPEYKWVAAPAPLKITGSEYNKDLKAIVISFNNDVMDYVRYAKVDANGLLTGDYVSKKAVDKSMFTNIQLHTVDTVAGAVTDTIKDFVATDAYVADVITADKLGKKEVVVKLGPDANLDRIFMDANDYFTFKIGNSSTTTLKSLSIYSDTGSHTFDIKQTGDGVSIFGDKKGQEISVVFKGNGTIETTAPADKTEDNESNNTADEAVKAVVAKYDALAKAVPAAGYDAYVEAAAALAGLSETQQATAKAVSCTAFDITVGNLDTALSTAKTDVDAAVKAAKAANLKGVNTKTKLVDALTGAVSKATIKVALDENVLDADIKAGATISVTVSDKTCGLAQTFTVKIPTADENSAAAEWVLTYYNLFKESDNAATAKRRLADALTAYKELSDVVKALVSTEKADLDKENAILAALDSAKTAVESYVFAEGVTDAKIQTYVQAKGGALAAATVTLSEDKKVATISVASQAINAINYITKANITVGSDEQASAIATLVDKITVLEKAIASQAALKLTSDDLEGYYNKMTAAYDKLTDAEKTLFEQNTTYKALYDGYVEEHKMLDEIAKSDKVVKDYDVNGTNEDYDAAIAKVQTAVQAVDAKTKTYKVEAVDGTIADSSEVINTTTKMSVVVKSTSGFAKTITVRFVVK